MMPKKEKKSNPLVSGLATGASVLVDILLGNLFVRVNEEADVLLDKAEKRALVAQEKLTKRLGVSLVVAIGAFFLLLALLFYLHEQMGWSWALAYVVLGAVMLVLGFLLKYQYLKENLR